MNPERRCLLYLLFFLAVPLAAEESFSFSSDSTKATLSQGKEETVLSGNARIISGSTEIAGDYIRLFGTDFQYALGDGNLTIKDEQQGILIRSQSLFYDREKEITRVKGYNEMEDFKNELVVKSNFLENHGKGTNITYIQIGVRILKAAEDGEMICKADFAIYYRDTSILELTGTPEVTWKGDTYAASKIVINLDTDEITLEGNVSGSVQQKENDDETESSEGPVSGTAPETPAPEAPDTLLSEPVTTAPSDTMEDA
ncbi:MAG: hypothetical protein JXB03_05540 [Spirochaetales bacterium]|nr:hypothetical protein [Spirochaetales bacterium]